MKVAELINIIDKIAPFYLQLNFDNSGIQFGDLKDEVNKHCSALMSHQKS